VKGFFNEQFIKIGGIIAIIFEIIIVFIAFIESSRISSKKEI